MRETTHYQRKRDVILNRAKDYYKNQKERLRDNKKDKYRHLSEGKKKKQKEMEKIDIIICLKKEEKLKEYQNNYCEANGGQKVLI